MEKIVPAVRNFRPEALLVAAGFVANFLQVIVLEKTGQKIMHTLRQKLFSHMLTLETACVLPHIGSATREARDAMSVTAARNILDFIAGRAPRFLVNPGAIRS